MVDAATGVKSLAVIVEDLGQDDKDCGLTIDVLKTRVNKTLLDNHLRVVDLSTPSPPFVHIMLTSIKMPSQMCITHVQVTLRGYYRGALRWMPAGTTTVAEVLLKSDGELLTTGSPSGHPTRVLDTIGRLVEEAATFIRLQNQ
jgi:hypothetical protein